MMSDSSRLVSVFGTLSAQQLKHDDPLSPTSRTNVVVRKLLSASLVIVLLMLLGCAAPQKPPVPHGRSQPINTASTIELLSREARNSAGTNNAGAQSINDFSVDAIQSDISSTLFGRKSTPNENTQLQVDEWVERTVIVEFPFASTRFNPSSTLARRIEYLIQDVERVEIRGRSDGYGNPKGDRSTAHLRAEAAKRYLLSRGVASDAISVNFQAAGDYVADNSDDQGRLRNRRVEIEFFLPEQARVNRNTTPSEKVTDRSSSKYDQWQAVTKGSRFFISDEWQPVNGSGL